MKPPVLLRWQDLLCRAFTAGALEFLEAFHPATLSAWTLITAVLVLVQDMNHS